MRGKVKETLKNDEYFKIGESENITVSVTFQSPEGSNVRTALLNAAEALKFYADNNVHKAWASKIEVR